MSTPHEFLSPEHMAPSPGFSHVAVAAAGRTIYVAGQIAVDGQGIVVGTGLAEQFDVALANVVAALEAAGARPEHVVTMTIYTTTIDEYREELRSLGPIWRAHMGRHYPAMALIGVAELVEREAVVEILATAVVPDD